MNARRCVLAAAVALAAAVVLGAFGAHAVKNQLAPELFAVYQTAVQYHFWHALGLLGVGILMAQMANGARAGMDRMVAARGPVLFLWQPLRASADRHVLGRHADTDRRRSIHRGVVGPRLGCSEAVIWCVCVTAVQPSLSISMASTRSG